MKMFKVCRRFWLMDGIYGRTVQFDLKLLNQNFAYVFIFMMEDVI